MIKDDRPSGLVKIVT